MGLFFVKNATSIADHLRPALVVRRAAIVMVALLALVATLLFALSYTVPLAWSREAPGLRPFELGPSLHLAMAGGIAEMKYVGKRRSEDCPEEAEPESLDAHVSDLSPERVDYPPIVFSSFYFKRDVITLGCDVYRCSQVRVPTWFPLVLTLPYPCLVLVRGPIRRWTRRLKHLCPRCGYSRIGNVSGVCPECGTPIRRGATNHVRLQC